MKSYLFRTQFGELRHVVKHLKKAMKDVLSPVVFLWDHGLEFIPDILLKIHNLPNSSVRFVNGLPISACVGSYFSLTAVVWRQTCCGAEIADYKNGLDITAEPSCHFLLLLHKEWSVAVISCQLYTVNALPKSSVSECQRTHTRGVGPHVILASNLISRNKIMQSAPPAHPPGSIQSYPKYEISRQRQVGKDGCKAYRYNCKSSAENQDMRRRTQIPLIFWEYTLQAPKRLKGRNCLHHA